MNETPFQAESPIKNYPQFPEVMLDHRAGYRRVTEQFASIATRLAWLNRILIAAISRRINGNFFVYWSLRILKLKIIRVVFVLLCVICT